MANNNEKETTKCFKPNKYFLYLIMIHDTK